jgi:hypothetical protein
MNIESLNKSQIVLLTLLVSFVTSIATGIVTVALMSQAPPAITQTINRVVEHTVERIVPAQQVAAAAAAPVVKTVIVKQSDAIAQAVATVSSSVVRIVLSSDKDATPIAIGVAVSPAVVATDSAGIKDGVAYSAILADGTTVPLGTDSHAAGGIALLGIRITKGATSTPKTFTPAGISAGKLQLGQVAIALTGLKSPRIATGVITSLSVDAADTSTTTPATSATAVETNISLDTLASGTPFVDTDGNVLGIYTISTGGVVPASVISALIASLSAPAKAAN